MSVRDVIITLNQMRSEGVIDRYAIGGAVGATFYLEPVATLDVDVFVALQPEPGRIIIDPGPIYRYLTDRGCPIEGEYILVAGWPVQFLGPGGPLVEEALARATETDVEGVPVTVFTAEHLAAICLQTGRAKDKARLLQFIESGVVDTEGFQEILAQHALQPAWERFKAQFIEDSQ